LDDKVLTSWNGLMLGALARAGRALGLPEYGGAAERAARFLLDTMRRDGRLLRSYRDGVADLGGYLEDYAFLASGLLDLQEASGDARWRDEAAALADAMLARFWDDREGGFFYVPVDHEHLITRTKDVFDESIPSGSGMAAQVLARLAAATGEARYARRVAELLDLYAGVLQHAPRAAESLLLAYALALDSGILSSPGAAGAPPQEQRPAGRGPLLLCRAQRGPVEGRVTSPRGTLARGEALEITLTLELEPGWHIQSVRPSGGDLAATSVEVGAAEGLIPGEMRFPEGSVAPLGGERLSVYAGRVAIALPISATPEAPVGRAPVVLRVRHQACDERRCLAPDVLQLQFALELTA
jgi:hypothetical protein